MRNPKITLWLSRFCLAAAVALFAAGAWLYFHPEPRFLSIVNPDLRVGELPLDEETDVVIQVANACDRPLRVLGVDGELC